MNQDRISFNRQRLIDAVTMFVVSAASICLLLYVAFGEARRTYEKFQVEKLEGQAELVQGALENYLRSGLPIRQFAGFANISETVMSADKTIAGIVARDLAGNSIFQVGATEPMMGDPAAARIEKSFIVNRSARLTEVAVPLRNRFEQVGILTIVMRRDALDLRMAEAFTPLCWIGAAAAVLFTIYTLLMRPSERMSVYRRLSFVYAGVYFAVAVSVIISLIALYSEGAQAKAHAAAATLAGRLDDIAIFDLDYSKFDGIDAALIDFRNLNKDITSASVVEDGRIVYHTNPTKVGADWVSTDGMQVISLPLSPAGGRHASNLIVEIPASVAFFQIVRSAKNFAALFVSSGLVAILFMELGRALRESNARRKSEPASTKDSDASAISLVKPAYFLAVFVESLSYPFLPQFSQKLTAAFGVSAVYASAPFMAYYACFALALVPAERLERRFGARALIVAGLFACAASYASLAISPAFITLVLARAVAGIGQGILFIGVQSYILNYTRAGQRTQAAGVIVFGFQAGTLAGMAIGSQLVAQLGIGGVCVLSASMAVLTCVYAMVVVPDPRFALVRPAIQRGQGLWRDLLAILGDPQFSRSMALIGVPAKAIMTGVVLFAMPILLNQSGFAQEDVGQMTMIYAACVVVASALASQFVDRTGNVEIILFVGAVASGLGLLIVGMSGLHDWMSNSGNLLATIEMIFGIAVLGCAHGLINAPIITNVANSPVATRLGASSVAATYRLLERVGHIAGPMIVSQAFLQISQSWVALCWIALGTIGLGLLFIGTSKASPGNNYEAEVAP